MPRSDLLDVLAESRSLGFLGPGPVDAKIAHSMGFASAAPGGWDGPNLDLGAGGGLPGLVLATANPGSRWVLLDANERRTEFLASAVERLGLADRVEVLRTRAEEAGRDPARRGRHARVVSRSFGPPAVVAECAAPLLRVGGLLVVSEPTEVAPSERWPTGPLALVGLLPSESMVPSFACIRQVEPCPGRYPRRVGVPTKRPLY